MKFLRVLIEVTLVVLCFILGLKYNDFKNNIKSRVDVIQEVPIDMDVVDKKDSDGGVDGNANDGTKVDEVETPSVEQNNQSEINSSVESTSESVAQEQNSENQGTSTEPNVHDLTPENLNLPEPVNEEPSTTTDEQQSSVESTTGQVKAGE
ncbi:MAG: hypothetical protein IJ853_02375 [Rickettsiales bacterium]|nr:hypothetical protein [Rickettsiales bacterium]